MDSKYKCIIPGQTANTLPPTLDNVDPESLISIKVREYCYLTQMLEELGNFVESICRQSVQDIKHHADGIKLEAEDLFDDLIVIEARKHYEPLEEESTSKPISISDLATSVKEIESRLKNVEDSQKELLAEKNAIPENRLDEAIRNGY